jgi:hypothetical protein
MSYGALPGSSNYKNLTLEKPATNRPEMLSVLLPQMPRQFCRPDRDLIHNFWGGDFFNNPWWLCGVLIT